MVLTLHPTVIRVKLLLLTCNQVKETSWSQKSPEKGKNSLVSFTYIFLLK